MRFKVEALPIWKERNITCADLNNKIPKAGEQWEVDKERLDVLLGDNPFNQPFVKLVEEVKPVKEVKKETNKDKPIKKTAEKKQTKKAEKK